jgi:RecA/RadA recombinase
MSAKKTTTKKVAKRATKKSTELGLAAKSTKQKLSTSIEDPDNLQPLVFKRKFDAASAPSVYATMTEHVRKSIDVVSNRSKTRKINLLTPAMLRKMLFEYDDIYMQYALSSVGFRLNSTIEVVAPEHIGKTTFCFDMIGKLAAQGCYAVYIECEGKMMKDKHIKRLMHRDKKTAAALINNVVFATARSLVECDAVIKQTVSDLRTRCDSNPATKGNPIWVFIDPWSGLMSSAEAKGNSDWGLAANAKKEAAKDAGTGSNQGHAKHAHILKRWLPNFLEQNNAVAMFFNHQNVKIDMNARKIPGMPPPPESKNDTTIGGKAFKQFTAYRWTMIPKGSIKGKDKKTEVGQRIMITIIKNAFGPKFRKCEFDLFYDAYNDTATTYDRVISFAEPTCTWMAQNKILDTTVSNGLFTCDILGCVAVDGATMYAALQVNPTQLAFVGAALDIEGYESEVDAAARERLLALAAAGDTSGDVVEESDTDMGGDEDGDEEN